MKRILIILIGFIGIASCQKNSPETQDPVEITLSAVIENGSSSTKAPFQLLYPTPDNTLTAAIWASTKQGSYRGSQDDPPPSGSKEIDYHNSTCFTSKSKQLLDHQLFYPPLEEGKEPIPVYFVGFCPRSEEGWSVLESTVGGQTLYNIARYEFDGKTDVMYAHETTNSIASSAEDLQLSFHHLLTWLKFDVAADKDAIEAWGKVKRITLKALNDIKINISDHSTSFENNVNNFPTYCVRKGVFTDDAFSLADKDAIELSETPQEVAYTLCHAVDATSSATEYNIIIETMYRTIEVPINLIGATGSDFTGKTGGCQFTVTLRFKLGDNVATIAQITEWENGGVGVASIDEDEE